MHLVYLTMVVVGFIGEAYAIYTLLSLYKVRKSVRTIKNPSDNAPQTNSYNINKPIVKQTIQTTPNNSNGNESNEESPKNPFFLLAQLLPFRFLLRHDRSINDKPTKCEQNRKARRGRLL